MRVTHIVRLRPRPQVRRDPGKVLGDVRRIDDQQETVLSEATHGEVVEEPSRGVTQGTVVQLVRLQWTDIVEREILEGGGGAGTRDLDFAHVADIEEPGMRADALMLGQDAAVG